MFKKLTLFALFLGLAAVVVGLVLSDGNFEEIKSSLINRYNYEYEQVTKTGTELINDVELDLTNNNITINYSEDETYSLDYYSAEEDYITVTINEGKLHMLGREKRPFKLFNFYIKSDLHKKVTILLPKSFAGNINADITSGDLVINDLSINNINVQTTSGSINLSKSIFNNINIELTSGHANIKNVESIKLNTDLTSGRIDLENVLMVDVDINATSGGIHIKNSEISKVNLEHTSGRINVVSLITNSITADMTSGDTNITIVGNKADYKAILDTTTGSIYYDNVKYKDSTINPEGIKLIQASSVTGDIKITFTE